MELFRRVSIADSLTLEEQMFNVKEPLEASLCIERLKDEDRSSNIIREMGVAEIFPKYMLLC